MIVSRKDRVFRSFSSQELKRGEKLLFEVAARNPRISDNGYIYFCKYLHKDKPVDIPFLEKRATIENHNGRDVIEFLACRSFLKSLQATSTAMNRDFGSYGLKHRIEENSLYAPYVSNGILLLAANSMIGKGVTARQTDGPNGEVRVVTDKDSALRNRKSLVRWRKQIRESPLNESGFRHAKGTYDIYWIASLHEQGTLETVPCW